MIERGLVHIVDDDAALRSSLESLMLASGNDARQYSTASEFLATQPPTVPSCILLDVRLPGTNGLDFQESLRKRGILLPVILMTGYGDIQMSVRGMKAGAVDFLTKPFRHQDVLDAVSMALARDKERRREAAKVSEIRDRYDALTPRELDVIALVTAGKMNKQIAAALNLSEPTVKIHRGSIMKKMGARSVAELVKMTELLRLAQEQVQS